MKLKLFLMTIIFILTPTVHAVPDYYQLLGVSRNASQEEIKAAYRRLIRKYHPDLNSNSKTSTEIAKKINEAYQNLENETVRAKYDADLSHQPKPRTTERAQATERSSANPFRKVDPNTEEVFRGTGGRSSWERDSASEQARRRANGKPFAEAEAKKYQWENFDQPKPEAAKPQSQQQQTRAETPKQEAPRAATAEPRPASAKPTAPSSPQNPNLNIYKTPKCSKEFLGTVIDILT